MGYRRQSHLHERVSGQGLWSDQLTTLRSSTYVITQAVAVVLAAGMRPQITLNPLTSVETMTTYIVAVTGGEASYGSPKYLSLFAVGMVLFAITLTLNIVSGLVLRRYREVYQ